MKKIITLLFTVCFSSSFACTIFIANDGKNVWIGNNEDDSPNKNYRLWYNPSKAFNENGYIIWASLLKGAAEKYSDRFPEGGINEYGLFIDAAALPERIFIKKDSSKKDWRGYVIKDVLKKCKTVQETLAFLRTYNLVEQEKAQIFIADASGDYAIVHANYTIKKQSPNFSLTNYCISDDKQHSCWRRNIVDEMLNSQRKFNENSITNILQNATQNDYYNKTNYSIVANLKEATIVLYQNRDFTTSKKLSIKDELAKGERMEDMVNLFPKNIAPVLESIALSKGAAESITYCKQLYKDSADFYNFKNKDLPNFGIKLLSFDKVEEAKELFEYCNTIQLKNNYSKIWSIIANKIKTSKMAGISSKLKKDKQANYLYQLFNISDGITTEIYLPYFENATNVLLAGSFTNWKDNAIKMEKKNGMWYCKLTLPKGEHQYKYVVDDSWNTDPINMLTTMDNKNVNSKLIVW